MGYFAMGAYYIFSLKKMLKKRKDTNEWQWRRKRHYQIFRLAEGDEAAGRQNSSEITEKIQRRDAKVWAQQCQRKGEEQMDGRILSAWIQHDLEPEEPSDEAQAQLFSGV